MMKNMKKIIALFFMTVMLLSLAGCGKSGIERASMGDEDSDVQVYDNDDGTKTFVGRTGSNMRTQWFDFTVNDAYQTTEAIGGYTPSAGNVLVVVDMTLKNTFTESVPMSDWDFQLQWGDDSDDAFAFPVETNEAILDNQFESEFTMKINQEVNGCYIFEAPEGYDDFSVSFLEYYEDDTEGNLYFVYFSADEK